MYKAEEKFKYNNTGFVILGLIIEKITRLLTDLYVGYDCMFASNAVIATLVHPILPILREHNYVYNIPVHIGKYVWIGSGVQGKLYIKNNPVVRKVNEQCHSP
jgi:hypothetical protein